MFTTQSKYSLSLSLFYVVAVGLCLTSGKQITFTLMFSTCV